MSQSSSVLGRGQLGEDFEDGVGLAVWLGLVVELGLRLD